MMTKIVIMSIILSLLTAKKSKVFGQLTLDGQKALDWLKNGVVVTPRAIEFGHVVAFVDEWNIPEWADGIIAIIHPLNDGDRPVLVTQKSALRILEAKCAEWEADGANCKTRKVKGAVVSVIDFGDHSMELSFRRTGKGKFDPYEVKMTE